MLRITESDKLTPIIEYDGILYKRDDLYLPFHGILEKLGGGKTRQMQKLMKSMMNTKAVKGIITTSSVHSPQSVIVAKVCMDTNIPCIICIGGDKSKLERSIQHHKTLYIAKQLGAEIRIVSRLGFDSVLLPFAENISKQNGYDIIKFGINLKQFPDAIIGAIASQVENIPNELDYLIVPCGSGVTFAGIAVGIKKYKKRIKNIIVIQISGYDRTNDIDDILDLFQIELQYQCFIDYKYNYTEKVKASIFEGFDLSLIYEAKAYKYFQENRKALGIKEDDSTLFWVIGDNNFLYDK